MGIGHRHHHWIWIRMLEEWKVNSRETSGQSNDVLYNYIRSKQSNSNLSFPALKEASAWRWQAGVCVKLPPAADPLQFPRWLQSQIRLKSPAGFRVSCWNCLNPEYDWCPPPPPLEQLRFVRREYPDVSECSVISQWHRYRCDWCSCVGGGFIASVTCFNTAVSMVICMSRCLMLRYRHGTLSGQWNMLCPSPFGVNVLVYYLTLGHESQRPV